MKRENRQGHPLAPQARLREGRQRQGLVAPERRAWSGVYDALYGVPLRPKLLAKLGYRRAEQTHEGIG